MTLENRAYYLLVVGWSKNFFFFFYYSLPFLFKFSAIWPQINSDRFWLTQNTERLCSPSSWLSEKPIMGLQVVLVCVSGQVFVMFSFSNTDRLLCLL